MPRFSDNSRRKIFRAAVIGAIAFVVLTSFAMFVYPGGTRDQPDAARYYFGQNFFSDLGRTKGFAGNSNIVSMLSFSAGLAIVGCTTALFFVALRDTFGSDRLSRFVSAVMVCFGLLAGVGFVGIAFTPWDRFFTAHNFFVDVGFDSLLVACLAAMVNVYRTAAFPNLFGHLMVVVSAVLLGYILLLQFGPSPATASGLMIQVGGQKIVAYVLIGGISALAIGAMRIEKAT